MRPREQISLDLAFLVRMLDLPYFVRDTSLTDVLPQELILTDPDSFYYKIFAILRIRVFNFMGFKFDLIGS